jgi:peptidoglycan/xylan/chitin deacetylase (PgdA/CDA1 family)
VLVHVGGLVDRFLSLAHNSGLTGRITDLRRVLTVICYHRVGNIRSDGFVGFRPNISASPEDFERQIEYVSKRFAPISIVDLVKFIERAEPLPPRPVLVTFDDGYKDNADIAWPILQRRNVPAVVFLATDHVGSQRPFLWDFAAYCFHYTTHDAATVPLLGPRSLRTSSARCAASESWMERSKSLPASERWKAAHTLRRALNVAIPDKAFSGLYLSWADVRRLAAQGLHFGGHTKTHPILTRMPINEAREEIFGSYNSIRAELSQPPLAFAYPNGSRFDFCDEHEALVREGGYSVAFSLEAGPTSLAKARQAPMAIRRVNIGADDNMGRFAAKLAGAGQIAAYLRQYSRHKPAHAEQYVAAY